MFKDIMTKVNSSVPYRPDIHGLRAWAVVAVLLFHFKFPGASAGFVGVDIFFVISGFLMASIIVGGLESDNFSIWNFYLARVRRIVPVLVVLLAVLLAIGWFWLPVSDYKSLGAQSAYSLAFMSNIYYLLTANYFDVGAQEKWLLHTWSLGVEFQFYVLFPIFMLFLWKIKPQIKIMFYGLGAVFFASLVLSVGISASKPAEAFYLLPVRGWELVAGGLAFLIGREIDSLQRFSASMLYAGLLLWICAALLVDSRLAWPSSWALLPVMGTVLIIVAQKTNNKLMVNPLAKWLGDRSYSLYLWHWPLVVALDFAGLSADWAWAVSALCLSLLLGDLSYRLVEVPARKYLATAGMGKQLASLGVAGLLVGASAVGVKLLGFEGRLPAAVESAVKESANINPFQSKCFSVLDSKNNPIGCSFNEEPLGVYLIGDSHADSVFTSLGHADHKYNKGAMYWARSGCPTLRNAKNNDLEESTGCYEFNNYLFKYFEERNDVLPLVIVDRVTRAIIGGNEELDEFKGRAKIYFDKHIGDGSSPVFQAQFRASLIETSCMLAKRRPVYLVRPIPEIAVNVPKTLARNVLFGLEESDIKVSLSDYFERHEFVWRAQDEAAEKCGVKILNPLPYLCDDAFCYGSRDGRPLYYDDDHLSEYGNKLLLPMFESILTGQ
jgi:peptidoglycan/LPS O-acetylase OafA/YrhL